MCSSLGWLNIFLTECQYKNIKYKMKDHSEGTIISGLSTSTCSPTNTPGLEAIL